MIQRYGKYIPYFLFAVTLIATLVSLFFSEVMKLPACTLCWYQRIAMYPLVIIISVAIIKKDLNNLIYYVLPISIIGWLIALYQNLLYYNIIPESIAPCTSGVPCTTKFIQLFGFIDIPLGSFLTFTFIIICTIILFKIQKKH